MNHLTKVEQVFRKIFLNTKNNNIEEQKEKIYKIINKAKDSIYSSLVKDFLNNLERFTSNSIEFLDGKKNDEPIAWTISSTRIYDLRKHFNHKDIDNLFDEVADNFANAFKEYGEFPKIELRCSNLEMSSDSIYCKINFKTSLNLLSKVCDKGQSIWEKEQLKQKTLYTDQHKKNKIKLL